jgi:NitT/TauT family transport system substrate-binding protein
VRRRTTAVRAAIALAAITLVTACGGSGSSGSSDGVEISVTHPEDLYGLPWAVGRERGFFEDAGITISKIVPAEGGGATLQNVVAGRLPFGEVATGAVVNGFNEGAPIQVIGGGVQSVSDVLWVVEDSSELTAIKDLAGTTWGYTNPGSVTEAMSQMVPEVARVEGVETKSTGGTGAGIALLEAGDVDVAYAPPRTVAEQGGALREVVSSSDFVPVYQQTVIVTGRDYAEKNPEETRALLEGYRESVQWITDNPSKAAELWAADSEIDPAVAEQLVQTAVKADHWGVAFNADALSAAADGLALTEGIESVDWSKIATDEFLPEGEKGQLP